MSQTMSSLRRLSEPERTKRSLMHVLYGPRAPLHADSRCARSLQTIPATRQPVRQSLTADAGMVPAIDQKEDKGQGTLRPYPKLRTISDMHLRRGVNTRSFRHSATFQSVPASKRSISTIMQKRADILASKLDPDKEINLKEIMDDMRDLELLDKFRKVSIKTSTGYKDAARALYPLWHSVDDSKGTVTFAQLSATLPLNYSIPWNAITERLLYGGVEKLRALSGEERAALNFMRVYNVGESRATAYVYAGARTFADLEILAAKKAISLAKAQRIGIKHLEDIERLIPRSEMDSLSYELFSTIRSIDKKFECQILGSYRRGVDFSSDIDLAVRHPSFTDNGDEDTAKPLMESIITALEDKQLVLPENQLMRGVKKVAGLIRLPEATHFRRIDIRLAPYTSYPYMLLGGSGDALLMKFLRHTAKQKNMTLNEYGLGDKHPANDQNPCGFKEGTMRIVKNEQEIFELLGMPYLKPEQREFKIWRGIYEKAGVDVSYIDKL